MVQPPPPLPPAPSAPPPAASTLPPNPQHLSTTSGLAAAARAGRSVSQTTPMRVSVIMDTGRGSAVSSLAVSTEHGTNINARGTPVANNKRPAPSYDDDDESASPKRAYPDFSKPESDDNSVISGDDSKKWAKDEEKMIKFVEKQNRDEDEMAANAGDTPLSEVPDWYLMCNDDGLE